jgi:hypothetical protein
MADTGQRDQALITGRIAYGYDGSNAYPLYANSAGTDIKKTIQTNLLPLQAVAASTIVKSSELDLTNVKKATFFIDHGRTVVTAWGAGLGTVYRIQVSEKATGNDTWVSMTTYVASSVISVAVVADADNAAGASTILCGTAVAVAGDNVFWANSTTVTNGEFGIVASVSGTVSFTLLDPLTYAQDSDTNIFTQAEHWVYPMDATGYTRARVVVQNVAGTTYAIQARVAAITQY